jgi:muconolactone delta-isomerase
MSLRSSLYRSARVVGDVEALASGDPKRITRRRAKNKLVGRMLRRSGFWRFLWR